MHSQLPAILVDAQYLAAGLALVVSIQQLLSWEGSRSRVALWSGVSAASFTATLLVNVWVVKAPVEQIDAALLVRSVLLVCTLTVQIPTVAALTGSPTPRRWLAAVLSLGIVRLSLWLTTDAIYAHRIGVDGAPVYGSLIAAFSLPPLLMVLVVVGRLALRFSNRVERASFFAGLAAASVLLVASLASSDGPAAELLTGYWIVPWIAALQVIAVRRGTLAEHEARHLAAHQLAITEELTRTERRSTLALRAGGMSWYEWDPATRALTASAEFAAMLGVSAGQMPATIDAVLDFVHRDDRSAVRDAIQTTLAVGREAEEFRVVRADGVITWLEARGRTMQGPDGRIEVLGVVRDVTDRKVAQHELTHLATHDPLTGLPNRAALALGLRSALDRGEPFALLLMDLDRFKDINDTLGHPIGDEVLVAVARRLEALVRRNDLVARIGGDEFALVVSDRGSTAARVAEQVLASLRAPIDVDGVAITVRASIGIVEGRADGGDAATLLRRADAAMYGAKARGGGIHRYVDTDDLGATRRLQLAGQLPGAIAAGQIELHYQPTIQIMSGRAAVVEALARWRHPELGLVSPAEFVPLAEHYGLGLALAQHVLAEALAVCSQWRSGGLVKRVAVNVSPNTLLDPSFVGHVATALARAGLPGSALTIEITENAFAQDSDELRGALGQLAEMGVELAIDDFGTGYSSLAYLERLPVHSVKLDRVFAAGLSTDGANDAIVALSIEMAHRLGLTVVAEGVESTSALAALAGYGCDAAQGFEICRPAARDEITAWLLDNMQPSLRRHAVIRDSSGG